MGSFGSMIDSGEVWSGSSWQVSTCETANLNEHLMYRRLKRPVVDHESPSRDPQEVTIIHGDKATRMVLQEMSIDRDELNNLTHFNLVGWVQ
jgi:hypothetical protein